MIDGIRLASKQDIPALCAVWKASFPDDDDYIQYFYEENFDRIKVQVYVINDVPVSIVHIMDCCFAAGNEQRNAKFLYAGGTLPDYRKKGCFTKLMKYVTEEEKRNGNAVFLKPSAPEYIEYYKRFGFEPDSYFRLVTVNPGEIQPLSVSPLSYEKYNRMRNSAFSHLPYAKWDDRHIKWCVDENEYFSGKTLAVSLDGEEYFLMASPEGNTLTVTETNLSVSQLKRVSGALCDIFGTDVLKAYMPEFSCNEGERIIASVVDNAPLISTYVNLILI